MLTSASSFPPSKTRTGTQANATFHTVGNEQLIVLYLDMGTPVHHSRYIMLFSPTYLLATKWRIGFNQGPSLVTLRQTQTQPQTTGIIIARHTLLVVSNSSGLVMNTRYKHVFCVLLSVATLGCSSFTSFHSKRPRWNIAIAVYSRCCSL
jgi:hypothetical protein